MVNVPTSNLDAIARVRDALAAQKPTHTNWKKDGTDGEGFAREWMTARGIEFLDIPQDPESFNEELKAAGGKRPDFVVKWPGTGEIFILFDAKHHNTGADNRFRIDKAQIASYKKLESWAQAQWLTAMILVVFIVVAKGSDGRHIYIVGLDEIIAEDTICKVGSSEGLSIGLNERLAEW